MEEEELELHLDTLLAKNQCLLGKIDSEIQEIRHALSPKQTFSRPEHLSLRSPLPPSPPSRVNSATKEFDMSVSMDDSDAVSSESGVSFSSDETEEFDEKIKNENPAVVFPVDSAAKLEVEQPRECNDRAAASSTKMKWKATCRQICFMSGIKAKAIESYENYIEQKNKSLSLDCLICSVALFHHINKDTLIYLAQNARYEKIAAGTLLFESGSFAKFLYIIKSGSILMFEKHCSDEVNILQIGEAVGIDSILYKEPMKYSGRCKFDSEVALIPADVLFDLRMELMENYSRPKDIDLLPNEEESSLKEWLKGFREIMDANNMYSKATISDCSQCRVSRIFLQKQLLLSFSPQQQCQDTFQRIVDIVFESFNVIDVEFYLVDHNISSFIVSVSQNQQYGSTLSLDSGILGRSYASKEIVQEEIGCGGLDSSRFSVVVPVSLTSGAGEINVVALIAIKSDSLYSNSDILVLKFFSEALEKELSKWKNFHQSMVNEKRLYTPSYTMNSRYSICIYSIKLLATTEPMTAIQLCVEAFHDHSRLCEPIIVACNKLSEIKLGNRRRRWHINMDKDDSCFQKYSVNENIILGIDVSNIPLGAYLVFKILNTKNEVVAWTKCTIFSFESTLHQGDLKLLLCNPVEIENGGGASNEKCNLELGNDIAMRNFLAHICYKGDKQEQEIWVKFNNTPDEILGKYNEKSMLIEYEGLKCDSDTAFLPENINDLIVRINDRSRLGINQEDKNFIWNNRSFLCNRASMLPAFLLSIDWSTRRIWQEAYFWMKKWAKPTHLEAIQMLSSQFSDPYIRTYAVQCLNGLSNQSLGLYLLQLVQALKFETYDDSSLSRFLLYRCLSAPSQLGHSFFWYLRSEVHFSVTERRFSFLLQQYLAYCGVYALELQQSVYVMNKLQQISFQVKNGNTNEERTHILHNALKSTFFPGIFQLPIQNATFCTGIEVEKCKVLSSKKKPLVLFFNTTRDDTALFSCIVKNGDDLRQDQLTLQIIRVMDDLWKGEGLDLELQPYGCLSTGDQMGLIEIIPNSETLAGIIYQSRHATNTNSKKISLNKEKIMRKIRAAKDAFYNDSVLLNWLMQQYEKLNENADVDDDFEKVIQRFTSSCAGYCVATYVLGIGDRHNDNIMIQSSGKFFHIDFGHFLGNFKSKLGIKRERAPFIFTPAMAFVIGGSKSLNFEHFVEICCKSFCILRRNANLFHVLFTMMLSSDIPELKSEESILYISKKLHLSLNDEQAKHKFRKLIYKSLSTKASQLNDAVHLLAH